MTSSPSAAATPQVTLARILAGVQRVFVVPVTSDGRLLLLRHGAGISTYWTYPTMQRGTMRTNPATVARRLIRQEVGAEPDGLRLVHILAPSRTCARSAVYVIALPQNAAEITRGRPAATGAPRRHAIQALAVTAETLAAIDVRPTGISALLSAGGSPAQLALTLPDLAAGRPSDPIRSDPIAQAAA